MKNVNKKFIFYFKILFVTIILLTMTFSNFVSADNNDGCEQQITKKYFFDLPYLSQVVIDDNVYNKIIMPNSPGIGNPGEPNLPVHEVRLLLPPELKVKEINVVPGEKIFLGSGLMLNRLESLLNYRIWSYFQIQFGTNRFTAPITHFPGNCFLKLELIVLEGMKSLL